MSHHLLPLLLVGAVLLGTGCSYVYSAPVRPDHFRAPGCVGPDEGSVSGGVSYYPSPEATLAVNLDGSIPLGKDWHVELGGHGGLKWLLGHGGLRKTWRGPLVRNHARPVVDLGVAGGLGAVGGFSKGDHPAGGVSRKDWPFDPDGIGSWDEQVAGGVSVDGGLGARVGDLVTPFLRARVQVSGNTRLPATVWFEAGGGVSVYPAGGPVGLDYTLRYVGYVNEADHKSLFVVGVGVTVVLSPPGEPPLPP